MQDRISLYPGRVTLTPVSGQTNTYDMERADSPTQEGTPLNKANLLKDATIAQFWLGSGAVPDDVFAWLGKYNEHWWSLHEQAYSYYEEKRTKITASVAVTSVKYSKSISVDQSTGAITLVSPTSIGSVSGVSSLQSKFEPIFEQAPVYVLLDNLNIYYLPFGATCSYGQDSNNENNSATAHAAYRSDNEDYIFRLHSTATESIRASTVSSKIVQVPAGETTYEHSTDRNAYPDSGTVDGITYSYLGVPFEKFPTMPRIATGSYTGTGTYGASNPNSLTFEFAPKLLIVAYDTMTLLWTGGDRGTALYGNTSNLRFSTSGTTVSWYSTSNANYQNNANGVTYPYVALG